MKRIMNRSVWALHQQLLAGSYTPRSFEISFSDVRGLEAVKVELFDGGKMHLQGRIDRIDTYETEDTVYVKVIDYKSGMAQFDPVSLYYGLQLQLLVYLNAALEMEQRLSRGKQTVPAGIFYYRMQDPMLSGDVYQTEDQIFEMLLKKLKPDGIVNSDRMILQTLDQGIGSDSLFVPAAFKKDGSLKAGSSAISTEQFAAASRFVRKKLKETGERIMGGEISARPAADDKESACDFCEYSQVCGFDRKLPGECEKRLKGMSKEEAWERICAEGSEEQQDAGDETERSGGQQDVRDEMERSGDQQDVRDETEESEKLRDAWDSADGRRKLQDAGDGAGGRGIYGREGKGYAGDVD